MTIVNFILEGTLRLVTSLFPSQTTLPTAGRLEIYLMDEWGTVCDDSFAKVDADFACKQLGFNKALDNGFGADLG